MKSKALDCRLVTAVFRKKNYIEHHFKEHLKSYNILKFIKETNERTNNHHQTLGAKLDAPSLPDTHLRRSRPSFLRDLEVANGRRLPAS